MFKCFTVFIISSIALCHCVKFPPEIPQCRIGDTECIKKTVNLVLKYVHNGNAKISLAAIDPLHINHIQLKQGAESPVNIELNFRDVDLFGLKDHTCTYMKGFQENPEGQYEMRFKGPSLVLAGPYTVKGRILILPITGSGVCNFTLSDPELLVKFTGKTRTKNGKVHLYTDDLKMTFTISRMHATLGNLYNGDRALGDSTNEFLNENWSDIYNEIKQAIFDAFSLITQTMMNNLFAHHDYKHLFLLE